MDNPDRPASSSGNPSDGSPEASIPADATDAKTERIAVMRHSLAELQRQLLEAQQRIAAELQGRAEDADRFEELEAVVQRQQAKSVEDAARIAALGDEIADLRSRLESATKTQEELRGDIASRDTRLEEASRERRELAEQLESRSAALRDAEALVATNKAELEAKATEREAELATKAQLEKDLAAGATKQRELTDQVATLTAEIASLTSARDALQTSQTQLEGELEQTRRILETGRARAKELAKQFTSLGQEYLDAVVVPEPPRPPKAASIPPPLPPPRPTAPPPAEPTVAKAAPVAEPTVVKATPEPAKPAGRSPFGAFLLVGTGIAVGVGFMFVIRGGSSAPAAVAPRDAAAEPSPPPTETVDTSVEHAGATVPDAPEANPLDASPATDASTVGTIVLSPGADGHRVFVDGRRAEPTNGRLEVPCGTHEVRIGGQGEPRTIDVPCGGEAGL